MIGMATLAGQITYANPAYRNGLGFEILPEKLTIADCIAQDSHEHLQTEVLPTMMQQGSWQGIIPFQHIDGSTFPVQTTGFLVRDEQGQPLAVASISRDITEQQRTEEKLRINQTLIENAPDAIGVADLNGNLSYGNRAFYQLFQLETLDGTMSIADLVVPAEREQHIQEAVRQTFEKGVWRGEVTYQRMDGTPIPCHVSGFSVRDSNGQNIATAAIIRDMSEQKRAEQRQTRLSRLVETSSDFIAFSSPDGREAYVNTAGRALVGLDADRDINSIPITDYHSPEDAAFLQQAILPTIAEQGIWKGEFRFRHFKTGENIPASYALFQIKDPMTDEITALGCVARDIREQKKQEAEHAALQQQVIEAQRSALRELSTPLIPITDNVVIMPLIGTIDSGRAQQVMEALLEGVAQYQAELAIIDITGVSIVDTQVAQALVSAAQAVRLLGAQVMLTGIQPQIAQTLVHLGIDLNAIQTRGNLQTGIAAALSKK
jgi:rsbT co-antagonist protein RsbR